MIAKGGCRTAPASTGLLKNYIFLALEWLSAYEKGVCILFQVKDIAKEGC